MASVAVDPVAVAAGAEAASAAEVEAVVLGAKGAEGATATVATMVWATAVVVVGRASNSGSRWSRSWRGHPMPTRIR